MQNKHLLKFNKHNGGYTIVETMIAISLFLIVVSVGMGALLNANLLHQKSQNMRSLMDSLNFIMEDMSKNLRTGYTYRCYDISNPWNQSYARTSALSNPQSCATGRTIVFENLQANGNPADNSDQWIYKIELAPGSAVDYNIYKSTTGGGTAGTPDWVQLNPPEVVFKGVSGFSVLGAESSSVSPVDTLQSLVSIRLKGRIFFKNTTTIFSLQTSLSPRKLDI